MITIHILLAEFPVCLKLRLPAGTDFFFRLSRLQLLAQKSISYQLVEEMRMGKERILICGVMIKIEQVF